METIFTVKNEHLERFNPEQAVDFFRKLLWAEATSLGIGKNLINVPSAITVADGGIDAEVRDVQINGSQGIIKNGLNRYQIKTGNFSPNTVSNVEDILFIEDTKVLKPRIKSCLDKNGRLVIVLFGWDNPDRTDNECINKFKEILEAIDKKYSNAKIEICRQNNLISFLNQFPSLSLLITGRQLAMFQTHLSWSRQADMQKEFKSGEEQIKLLKSIQIEMRRNDEDIHIRVCGEAGIGKTKLVLEATNVEDLNPLVIYFDSANKFRDSFLMNEIIKDDNQFHSILVIDECDSDSRSYIWNKLKYYGPRIKLITIYNEYDDTAGNIKYFNIPPLNKKQISSIIQNYKVPEDQADRFAELCSGSPRVAHVVGCNLRNNPEDLLKTPDTNNIWERYIIDTPNSQEVQERKRVLRYISLFKRFGFKKPLEDEGKAISSMISKADPQITYEKFSEIIKYLIFRKVLQGETTLYITPKLFHIYLWKDWWENYGNTFNWDNFEKELPETLLNWFCEMFKYAAESEAASMIVKELLGQNGPFKDGKYLITRLGANFFSALAEADPKSSLECLKRTIGRWSKGELLNFKTGRREIVWALEKISMWRNLFLDAAKLLLALGEAENESCSNNASGVFADLFSLGRGRLAPTEASPQERFPILEEFIVSDSKERRLLALNACDKALEVFHFSRLVGPEYQGLRKEPEQWMPKTWGELYNGYQKLWIYATER